MKKKILFFCENVTLAHVIRPLELAKKLKYDKYEIIFACDNHYSDFIKLEGFKIVHVNSQSNKEFTDKLFYAKQLFSKSQINNYLEEEFKIFDEIRPDLVVGDFRLTLGISCRVKKIPYISIINSRWSTYAKENVILPLLNIQKFIPFKILNSVFPLMWPFIKRTQIIPYKKFQKKYNLTKIKDIKEMYCDADYILYDDIQSIIKLINKPKNHMFLGPILWQPKIDLSKEIKQIPNDKKIIYFSMGSSGNLNQELIDALSDDNYYVLMSNAGKKTNIKLPNNFKVYDYIPALDILEKCDLCITNGGLANYQAFSKKVPVLMFPSNMDQYLFADLCEKNNLGIYLRLENSNKEVIQKTITKILNNEQIKENLIKITNEIDLYDSKKLFKNLIDDILK
ncbi:MAG: glycosyltransferase [Nanoarchaeota archaeon]|nr:glycosyltransferase [Nanoarchaeota archaeon]